MMRGYIDYIEETYLNAVGWDIDASYANIVLPSSNILDFEVPEGTSLHVSSQPTPYTFTSYSLSSLGSLKGSLAYLSCSVPLDVESSSSIPLKNLVQCYRRQGEGALGTSQPPAQTAPLPAESKPSLDPSPSARWSSLLYGRMYLPGQAVEAMWIQQVTRGSQLVSKWICDPRLPTPIIYTGTYQRHTPKWTSEYIYSSHENLLGLRMLVNLASWQRKEDPTVQSRLASGLEVFYAANKKSPGISIATRYSTHSRYTAVPLTLTLVSNPLMGSVSIAYAIKPTPASGFSSRYDFNLYSYLSDLTVGCELWRSKPISLQAANKTDARDGPVSVFKASTSLGSQTAKLLWEGSYGGFLVSSGVHFCYGDRAVPMKMGIEFLYTS